MKCIIVVKVFLFLAVFAPSLRLLAYTGVLKSTFKVPLVPTMHHTKFEKNSKDSYQEDRNVQLLTNTFNHFKQFGPTLAEIPLNPHPLDQKFGKGLPALSKYL